MKSGKKIEFLEYTGEYPNLCRGVLTVLIDGKEYKFGHNYGNYKKGVFTDESQDNPNYPEFWISGGNVSFSKNWDANVSYGPWEYNGELDDYQDEFSQDLIEDLLVVFNLNVRQGCCGGCI